MTEQGSMTEQGNMSDQGGMAGSVAEPGGMYGQGSMAEDVSMGAEAVGPIDYLAIELPAARMQGEGLAAIVDLVDRGIINVLDMRAVTREADGTFTAIAITDLDHDGTLDLAIFEGIESGLLDDDDLRQAAELIEPGKVVALLLYENTWARPFVAAMRRAGAELIASGRIPADEVEAMLDALEAEEAQAQAT
jgi:dihydroorotase-like cyclic amidohydrolase